MKKIESVLLNALYMLIIISLFSCDTSGISIEPVADNIKQYESLFIPFRLEQTYNNPYDPSDIRVDAVITEPDGHIITQPCFYKSGEPGDSDWGARFTPRQPGSYNYYIQVVNAQDSIVSQTYNLMVKASREDGFLHMNDQSWYTLRYDSGKPFRGVGLNICWENQSQWPNPYEVYFDAAKENDVNFIRIWMCSWNLPLEWSTIRNYNTLTDEFENWDNTFFHSKNLKLEKGLTPFTEDDSNRVSFQRKSAASLIFNLENIRRFKIKMFYHKQLSKDKIKCYGSVDNVNYKPIKTEFSETWDTKNDWHRIFLARITDLSDGVNYLKITFGDHLNGLQLANARIEHGDAQDIMAAPGLGRYYQKTAERLDDLLDLAKEDSIYIMLTLDYHGQFKDYIDRWASNAEWRTNPYNSANGGPCDTPADFFTNPEAKRYYKNRLRYLVARWGYSENLAVWEFWNEIDNAMEWQKIPAASITAWHKEMSAYLRKIDPYQHIISTSVASRPVAGLWELKNMDFSQHHPYGPTEDIYNQILKYENKFQKPDVLGEFALSWKPPGQGEPGELYEGAMHNGLWRGMFSPTPILPMTWWWEWHLHQKEYFHFKWANAFVQKMLVQDPDSLHETSVKCPDSGVETMALQSGNSVYIWILNHNRSSIELNELTLSAKDGTYSGYWFNPWTGQFSKNTATQADNGRISFPAIEIEPGKDMALWLNR